MNLDEHKLWLKIYEDHNLADTLRNNHLQDQHELLLLENVREVFKFTTDCKQKLKLGLRSNLVSSIKSRSVPRTTPAFAPRKTLPVSETAIKTRKESKTLCPSTSRQ